MTYKWHQLGVEAVQRVRREERKAAKIQLRGATREVAGSPRKPSKNLGVGRVASLQFPSLGQRETGEVRAESSFGSE